MVRNGIPRVNIFCCTERNSEYVLFRGTEFREFASILVPRNGIPSSVLFRRRVRNRIMEVCFYFCSTERNSELFSLPRKGSERNSEIFCSAEQPEFRRKKPFVPSIASSAELFFYRKFPTLGDAGR